MNKSSKSLTWPQVRTAFLFFLCLFIFFISLYIFILIMQKRIRSHCKENPSKVNISQYLEKQDSGTAFVFSPKDNQDRSYITFEILCEGKPRTYYFYRSGSWIIIRTKNYSKAFPNLLTTPNMISFYSIDGKRYSVIGHGSGGRHNQHLDSYTKLIVEIGIKLSKN